MLTDILLICNAYDDTLYTPKQAIYLCIANMNYIIMFGPILGFDPFISDYHTLGTPAMMLLLIT